MDPMTLALAARQRAEVSAILQGLTDRSMAAWARAWQSIEAELAKIARTKDWGTAKDWERQRMLLAAQERAAVHVRQAAAQSNQVVLGGARTLLDVSTTEQLALIGSQLPTSAASMLSRPAGKALDAIVQRTTQQITARHYLLGEAATASMRDALRLGMAAGDDPFSVASNMVRGLGDAFNGGVARAQVIARTELIDAHRDAATATMDANADVIEGWIWNTKLGPHTCPSCIAQHGTLHPLSEPGPLDHQQGRCARMPKTKSWDELGFHGVPDSGIQVQSGEAWFNRLTPEMQQQILGTRRYAAWMDGDYPINEWSVRRETDGWRDSYGVGPISDLGPRGQDALPEPPPGPLDGLDLAAMSPTELEDLAYGFMESGDWDTVGRVQEYLDAAEAKAANPAKAWAASPSEAFTPAGYDWFEGASQEQQDEFLDALAAPGTGMEQSFMQQQWGHQNATVTRAVKLPTKREMRVEYDLYIDVELGHLEAATNGFTVSNEARAKGYGAKDLYYGVNDVTAYSRASDETKAYWESVGGRMTPDRFYAGYGADSATLATRGKGRAW